MNSPRTSSFRRFTSLGEVAGLSNPADHRPTICVNRSVTLCPERWGIAEGLGFEVGMFASSIASLTCLAAPDHIVLTLSEFAGQVYRICRASNVPLLVDADHGYGNALNVMRTVEELETAGVAALSIENTELPQPYGFEGKARLISHEEAIGKMKAALTARQDPDLVIAGRISALALVGEEDRIARCCSHEDAGVATIFFVGIRSSADLEAVTQILQVAIVLGGAPAELIERQYLAQHIDDAGTEGYTAAQKWGGRLALPRDFGEEPKLLGFRFWNRGDSGGEKSGLEVCA